jgi:hypothetical protein
LPGVLALPGGLSQGADMRSQFEWYWQRGGQWREIVARPLPDDEKQEACLARDHVRRRAIAQFERGAPPFTKN